MTRKKSSLTKKTKYRWQKSGNSNNNSSCEDASFFESSNCESDYFGTKNDISVQTQIAPLVESSTNTLQESLKEYKDACTSPVKISSELPRQSVEEEKKSNFEILKESSSSIVVEPFVCVKTNNSLRFVEFYDEDAAFVKLSLVIKKDCSFAIHVHNVPIPSDHEILQYLPSKLTTSDDVKKVLKQLLLYEVCTGNSDPDFQELVPPNSGFSDSHSMKVLAYREGDVGGSCGEMRYKSTIRSTECRFLCNKAMSSGLPRCTGCSKYRSTLRAIRHRQERKKLQPPLQDNTPLYKSTKPHSAMTKEEVIKKCNQYKMHCLKLEVTVEKLKSKISSEISYGGEVLSESDSDDMNSIMREHENEVFQSFPNSNSFQRLFWDQQKKYNSLNNKKGMKWHPMMIKWCLYLRFKSKSAYSTLREMGFLNLPSERTLYDYSHYTEGGTGFKPDVVAQLIEEVQGTKECEWKKFVGLLQDEIKIKEDLVYDRHSGELIGFANLDDVGNSIMDLHCNFENKDASKRLAKYVLVLMVRGIATNLRFPLAHFASGGITADFLYPIIWEAVEILEVSVGLKVLFVTCDGASPNRKFFRIHQQPPEIEDSTIYCTPNTYSLEYRYLYFISDVPHLVKTARNCFANSFAHKQSRRLWFNRDISWLHIVDLYEEGVNNGLYNLCPKLTRSHVNLTSYSVMKVRLAAQVLSSTVANALEFTKPETTGATVKFIRYMNKFFDLLNTRNLFEARNKLNPNLAPYRNGDDERLKWLEDDFLKYFNDWKYAVQQRQGNFTRQQQASMMLSHQTIEGLKISVKSIVACVKFLLDNGAPFVLTSAFNQDALEQHFGHHRSHCGSNSHPNLREFSNNMTQLRIIGSQAISSSSGNCTRPIRENLFVDNAPLKRRRVTN